MLVEFKCVTTCFSMSSYFYFEIPGDPVPKKAAGTRANYARGNPRFNRQKKEMDDVRRILKAQYPHVPLDGPLLVNFVFRFHIPKFWTKKQKQLAHDGRIHHIRKPDVSNLIKFYEDCMSKTVFRDDCLIVRGNAIKIWHEKPMTQIWVREFTVPELQQRLKDLMVIDG